MEKQKIKIDLNDYFNIETSANFKAIESKAINAISSLYNQKTSQTSMAGWLDLPYDEIMYKEINDYTTKILNEGTYDHLLVLGIGGSSLGAQALIESLKTPLWSRLSRAKRKNFLTCDFIDNLDPYVIRAILDRLKLPRTLFIVVSKGGGTTETIVPMLIAKDWTGESFYGQCVFVTSKGKGLLSKLGENYSVPLFEIPQKVGGRYSVFSPAGLLPSALSGVDLDEIKAGIQNADRLCQLKDLKENPALKIALCAYFSLLAGKNIFVLMPYSACTRKFVDWFIQLWSESLGKDGKGSTPHAAIGATDQHSQLQLFNHGPNDKLICFVKINKHKRDLIVSDHSAGENSFSSYVSHKTGEILNFELAATRQALTENKRANFLISLPTLDEYYISQLMYIFEVATVVVANLIGVNPFDQPGVELAKKYTREFLELKKTS